MCKVWAKRGHKAPERRRSVSTSICVRRQSELSEITAVIADWAA